LVTWLAVIAFSCWSAPPAFAQTPTADQIDSLRNLSPEQQQAILESMQSGGGSGRGSRSTSDPRVQFPELVGPRNQNKQRTDASGSAQTSREPRFKANDSLLLNIEIRQLEPRAPDFDEAERKNRINNAQLPQVQQQAATAPAPAANPNDPAKSRIEAGQRAAIERTDEELRQLKDLRERLLRRNPYKLDKSGVLNVLELGPIQLAGLTQEEARERIAAELVLKDFIVQVTRLPLRATGLEALKPFGYDLFAGAPSTFAPATDVPVPAEYIVGPGDMIEVQLVGSTKGRYTLAVGRDGRINFPELGPIAVSGRRFEEVRLQLEQRVRDQMIGTQASVGIGELRSIRIFVLGDAESPGSYTVSGLSTVTNALFYSGGVKKIGSLRRIELKRNGVTISKVDLYDLLLKGDTRADVRLLPGDVIFVPPIGQTVSVAGEVRRPAIYELNGESTVRQLVDMAGGFTSQAEPQRSTLERVDDGRQRITVDVDLAVAAGSVMAVRNGDILRVPEIRPVLEDSVSLVGYLYRPGEFQYVSGMRLLDVLPSMDELKPNADRNYLLIRRELPPDRRIIVFSADLEAAIRAPNSGTNFLLAPRDRIYVFDLESGRDRIVDPLLRELRMQSNLAGPTREVSVAGKVKVPGKYPLEVAMHVGDLIRAGGSLDESAYGGEAEITRYALDSNGERKAHLITVDLQRVMAGDPAANVELQPFDYLLIKEAPLWANQDVVEIKGEVRFPGKYPIKRGETMRSLMERAGGVTDLAFVPGAVFTRKELKERERKQIDVLATRMQSDVAQFSLQNAAESGKDANSAMAVGQSLLAELRNAKPVGRLVIDLNKSARAAPGSNEDIVLKDGDQLLIPRVTQEVTVIGEVQSTTSHLYDPALSRSDYVNKSGGLTPRADSKRVYVVKADGSVVVDSGAGRWFGSDHIAPGDTIVAPLDTERMRPLPFWSAVTTIIYNLAISAAAVNSF